MTIFLVRTTAYLAGFAAFLLAERLAPFTGGEQRQSARVAFHLGISVANSALLYLILAPFLLAALTHGGGNRTMAALLGLRGWGEIVATVIVFDCWDYWMHRANHRIALLWRFHRAHHSDMELDVTTAARFHLGELLISGGCKCLVILLWGPSLAGLLAFDLLLNAASQFHHSNLGIPFPVQEKIERLVVTPRMHRCHHALRGSCVNTNFATVLSFWDRLFGSYHRAGSAGEIVTVGLEKPRGPATMALGPFLLTPFRAE